MRVGAKAGEPEAPVKVDLAGERGQISFAHFALPGDKGILLDAIAYGAKGWYYRVGVLDLKSARVNFLFDDGGHPVYSPTGHIVFSRGDTLLAVPFRPGRDDARRARRSPSPTGCEPSTAFLPARFELSNDGVLVYVPGGRTAEGRRLGLVDANGQRDAGL